MAVKRYGSAMGALYPIRGYSQISKSLLSETLSLWDSKRNGKVAGKKGAGGQDGLPALHPEGIQMGTGLLTGTDRDRLSYFFRDVQAFRAGPALLVRHMAGPVKGGARFDHQTARINVAAYDRVLQNNQLLLRVDTSLHLALDADLLGADVALHAGRFAQNQQAVAVDLSLEGRITSKRPG